jgi:cysteinyl-tRNA synthetase
MAKSVGNIALLHDVLDQYGAEAVVMYLISGHYRQPLAFSQAALEQAGANVSRIREAARRLGPGACSYRDPDDEQQQRTWRESFFSALASDFNTAAALANLNEWIRGAGHLGVRGDADLREMLAVLGLESLLTPVEQAPSEVRELAHRREHARADRDFAAADRLRDEIAALGWGVRDGAGGFELIPL